MSGRAYRRLALFAAFGVMASSTSVTRAAARSVLTRRPVIAHVPQLIWGGTYGGGIWTSVHGRLIRLTDTDQNPISMVLVGRNLWWANNAVPAEIERAPLEGEGMAVHLGPVVDAVDPPVAPGVTIKAIAVTPDAVYWLATPPGTSLTATYVGRADLDGSDLDPRFITNVVNSRLAGVDALTIGGGYLFWSGDGVIGRASLSGAQVQPSFLTGFLSPDDGSRFQDGGGLLVHDGSVYLSGTIDNERDALIGRAGVDGRITAVVRVPRSIGPAGGIATDGRNVFWGTESGAILGTGFGPPEGLDTVIRRSHVEGGISIVAVG